MGMAEHHGGLGRTGTAFDHRVGARSFGSYLRAGRVAVEKFQNRQGASRPRRISVPDLASALPIRVEVEREERKKRERRRREERERLGWIEFSRWMR